MTKIQKIVAISKRVALGLVVSAGLVASSPRAAAQLIAYEGFDYPEGLLVDDNDLGLNNGGFGWSDAWRQRDANTPHAVVATGLTYTDSAGKNLAVTGGANNVLSFGSAKDKRSFDPALSGVDPGFYFENNRGFDGVNVLGVPGTTIWISMLAQEVISGSTSIWAQLLEDPINFDRTKSRTANFGSVFNGAWGFGDIGNGTGAGANFTAAGAGNLDATDVAFLVARIDYGAGGAGVPDDEAPYETPVDVNVNVWLNPDLSTEPLLANADLKNFPAPTGVAFNGIAMGGNTTGFLDEFRVGTTYASVSPIAGTPGDFDTDGDIDGADFLLWQRDRSVGSLADWETNYGTTSNLSVVAAVPEPASAALAITAVLSVVGLARRRRGV